MDFPDRTVVVTGAAGNLGRAVAAAFAAANANLALVGRQPRPARRGLRRGTPRRLLLGADLLQRDDVERAVATTVERYGSIDVLCNITGGFRMGEPSTSSPMRRSTSCSMPTCARSSTPRTQSCRVMRAGNGGRIVNVAAFAARKGAALMGAYSAARARSCA